MNENSAFFRRRIRDGSWCQIRAIGLNGLTSQYGAQRQVAEYLVVEDANRKPNISKSVQRFQLAIDEAKVWLDLAVLPGTWLMPSNLLNRQSTVGYNNSLMKATAETKLGVNKSANLEMKSVGVRHKNGGSSKIKPSAHPRGGHPSIKVMQLQLKFRWRQNHQQVKSEALLATARQSMIW